MLDLEHDQDGSVTKIKECLSKKTALAYTRAWRAKGRKVYARKTKDGYAVFEKN